MARVAEEVYSLSPSAIGARYRYILSPSAIGARYGPERHGGRRRGGIFSLPFHNWCRDWCPLR
eukprot:7710042-Pyramimonas_sp.AAC.1